MHPTTLFLLFFTLLNGAASGADNFVDVTLPRNVVVELPRNWTALTRSQRVTLDTHVQSVTEKAGVFDASSDLGFGANYFEEDGKTAAIFNIRFYPELDLNQQDAVEATQRDIQELDTLLREGLETNKSQLGYSIVEWRGTKRQQINGATVFVTEYIRTPLQDNGEFCVRLIRVFRGAGSFTITVSYRSSQEHLLRPICDRIIDSIKVE